MSILSKIKPIASTASMLKRETDLQYESEVLAILQFHSFQKKDEHNLLQIADLLRDHMNEAANILKGYLSEYNGENGNLRSDNEIQSYLHSFFQAERNKHYFDELGAFFSNLIENGFPIHIMLPALNQVHFYFTTVILSKKGMTPNACLDLLTSLQKACNIDQQLLIKKSNQFFYESTAKNITNLIIQNTEIMYMKDFLDLLNKEDDQIHSIKAASEELSVSVDEVARHAVSVAESTDDAVDMSIHGQDVVGKAINEIIITNTEFEQVVNKVDELQQSVKKIERVVEVINDISEQTNLLALNAAIEAARAGDVGRGFAVVAEEVRKLSDNNVNSLKTVKENVTTLQSVSRDIYDLTNHTKNVINYSVKDAKEAIPLISSIIDKMKYINDQTSGTAATAEEQSAGVNEVARRMINISEISLSLTELNQHTIQGVYTLCNMLSEYRDGIFSGARELSEKTLLELAKSDHILWKWKIYNMLLGVENLQASDVTTHHECRLGKWYFDTSTLNEVGHYQSYKDLDYYHKLVHDCARVAVEAYNQNDIELAESHFKKLEMASKHVILLIDHLIEEMQV